MTLRMRSPDAGIARVVRRIVARFHPERVILFGSRARGDAAPDSDVDLLVVMPFEGSRRKRLVEMYVALGDFRWPTDIVIATPEEFDRAPRIPGSIVRVAREEGRVLYACS